MQVEVLSETLAGGARQWPEGWRGVLTHTHTFSGRADHGGPVEPPESYEWLAEWARRRGIDALGMGSPYTPRSAATYHRYDGPERDRYYAPGFDPLSVMDGDEVEGMLASLNSLSGGRTLFYLDNETPKGRYGHLWWLGYHPDRPPWHDYDQPFDRWMLEETRAGEHEDEPMPYERRPYLEIVALQRSRGALGFWAHPTSWWRGDAGQFVTNLATEMPAHVIAEGRLDGLVVMGYQPFRPEYQSIWFQLLDRGYRVPGVAEMDCGLSDPKLWQRRAPLLTYAWAPGPGVSLDRLVPAFRGGRVFASSGPFVDLDVDGHPTGQVAPTSPQQAHVARLTALPRAGGGPLDRVELLGRGGRVLWRREGFAGGTLELRLPGLAERGYLVARVLASDSETTEWRQPSQVAISNPVYLHPPGQGFQAPAATRVEVTVHEGSPFAGGEIRFETAGGELLGRSALRASALRETLPAAGRVTVVAPDGRTRTDLLLNANPALQSLQRYLYRGRFLRDFPQAQPGEVPAEAWRLDAYMEALREVRLAY